MITIVDFQKAAKKVGKSSWLGIYWLVGCPFREVARAILSVLQIGKNKAVSDMLSMPGAAVLLIGPIFLAFYLSFYWLLLVPVAVGFAGYTFLDGYGEALHGNPLAPGGELSDKNADGSPKAEKEVKNIRVVLQNQLKAANGKVVAENRKYVKKLDSLEEKLSKAKSMQSVRKCTKSIEKEQARHSKETDKLNAICAELTKQIEALLEEPVA